jgi:hypothetical protein
MLVSPQKVISLRSQHRQIVTVQAHDLCFILYSSAGVSLIDQFAIHEDRISELHISSVQKDDINSFLIYSRRYARAQIATNLSFVTTVFKEHGNINIAHRSNIPLHLRSKKIDQDDTGVSCDHTVDRFHDEGRFASDVLDFPSSHFTPLTNIYTNTGFEQDQQFKENEEPAGWNDAVEIVKTVEAVQIVGRPKQEVRREKGMME